MTRIITAPAMGSLPNGHNAKWFTHTPWPVSCSPMYSLFLLISEQTNLYLNYMHIQSVLTSKQNCKLHPHVSDSILRALSYQLPPQLLPVKTDKLKMGANAPVLSLRTPKSDHLKRSVMLSESPESVMFAYNVHLHLFKKKRGKTSK